MMKYEDFVYEFIKLLISWGTWNDSLSIYYGKKKYSPLESEETKENSFRDLRNVQIIEVDDTSFQDNWPKECEMFVEFNGAMNNLFEFGILEARLEELPLERKEAVYEQSEELQESFKEEYDPEEMKINPESYGIPSELEFDSADEYKEFIDDEMNRLEQEFINNLSGSITLGNDLEAQICELCVDNGLSYAFTGDGLFIGHDYF